MMTTRKFFATAIALFVLQITMGGITAHYAVEGQDFYGLNLSEILPYAIISRTWHTQLALFWIATTWLATGFYFALLVTRAILPAFRCNTGEKQVLWVFFLSSIAIGLFYRAGLFMGKHTHLALWHKAPLKANSVLVD